MIAQLVNELTVLGFSERIAQAYVLLAQRGEISVREIGERFSLTRPTAHDVMMSLVHHGLARTNAGRKERIFIMESPLVIRQKLEEKRKECEAKVKRFDQLLPNLQSLLRIGSGASPAVMYAEGIEEMTPMLHDFSQLPGDIVQLLDYETYSVMQEHPARESKRVVSKEEEEESKKIRSMVITDRRIAISQSMYTQVRAVSPLIVSAMGEMSVCGDHVLLLSHAHGVHAVQIRSQPIAEMCRASLNLAWCAAGKIEEWMS